MIVSDPTTDERFHQHPLVVPDPNIRFYAGVPLVTSDGYGLGTLCVIDSIKKELNDDQLKALDQLRRLAVQHLEFRKLNTIKDKMDIQVESLENRVNVMLKDIELKNAELQELSKVLSHDLRAPLRGISSLAEWMLEDYKDQLPEEVVDQLILIKDRTLTLK